MGCVASKLEEEEEVVSICRERKRFLKLAVQRRSTLAEAHFRYCESLCAVSAAVRLFVARHSSPASPFLITFSPNQPLTAPTSTAGDVASGGMTTSGMLPRHRPSDETVVPPPLPSRGSCRKGSSSSDDFSDFCSLEGEEVEEEGGGGRKAGFCEESQNGYYYMEMQAQAESPGQDFGWDFFNPFFGIRPEALDGYREDDDHHLRVVREEEGIPELEDEVVGECATITTATDLKTEKENVAAVEEEGVLEEVVGHVNDSKGDDDKGGGQKGMTFVDDDSDKGRELLEALGVIEDHFIRAYDSGKDVSRMLEASKVHLQSGEQGIEENSTKLLQSVAWSRSTLSRTTSCKSLMAYSSSSSSTWTEYKNDLFEDYDGMVSGSHSLTLERLYAWEKKLCEEVKAGDGIRKLYERKCLRIKDQEVRGDDSYTMDKNRAEMKDLHARILVAIRSAESISMQIEKLRDEELHPQIVELLKGLTQTWRIMSESHETQNRITSEVRNFACPSYGKFCNNFHRLATLQLEAELQNWRECFIAYVAAQKFYVEALNGWLSKFLAPEIEFCSRGRNSSAPYRFNGPPLLPICHNWLISLNKLPEKAVALSLKGFAKDVRVLWTRQWEEQHQKRKVECLARELEKRTPTSFPKSEVKFLEYKVSEEKLEPDPDENWYSSDKMDHLRRKLEVEKERHRKCMEETHRVTLNGFRTGFGAVFESLTEFSNATEKMYTELVDGMESPEKAENVPVEKQISDDDRHSHSEMVALGLL